MDTVVHMKNKTINDNTRIRSVFCILTAVNLLCHTLHTTQFNIEAAPVRTASTLSAQRRGIAREKSRNKALGQHF